MAPAESPAAWDQRRHPTCRAGEVAETNGLPPILIRLVMKVADWRTAELARGRAGGVHNLHAFQDGDAVMTCLNGDVAASAGHNGKAVRLRRGGIHTH